MTDRASLQNTLELIATDATLSEDRTVGPTTVATGGVPTDYSMTQLTRHGSTDYSSVFNWSIEEPGCAWCAKHKVHLWCKGWGGKGCREDTDPCARHLRILRKECPIEDSNQDPASLSLPHSTSSPAQTRISGRCSSICRHALASIPIDCMNQVNNLPDKRRYWYRDRLVSRCGL